MVVDASPSTGSLRTLGTGANQAAAGNDSRFASGVGLHASSHSSGGTDAVDVKNLAGYPGGTTSYLRADHTFATIPTATRTGSITVVIVAGTSVISTGVIGYLEILFACTIQVRFHCSRYMERYLCELSPYGGGYYYGECETDSQFGH